jgi:hypothetical protein
VRDLLVALLAVIFYWLSRLAILSWINWLAMLTMRAKIIEYDGYVSCSAGKAGYAACVLRLTMLSGYAARICSLFCLLWLHMLHFMLDPLPGYPGCAGIL